MRVLVAGGAGFIGSLPKELREVIESCRNGIKFNNKSF
jgi:nucleoside-diphosphate-sugar epimerase